MTKTAMKIFRQLHDTLVQSGVSRSGTHPGARDGYAAIWLWVNGGQPVERLTLADVRLIPETLRLDTSPIEHQAMGYVLPADPRDWIILARVSAKQPIGVSNSGYTAFAYPEPMLVWAGWRGERRSILSGCANLGNHPTVTGLRLGSGKNYGELGASDLTQADADDDLLTVGLCLGRFYAKSQKRPEPVIRSDGHKFDSPQAAADALGVPRYFILKAIRLGTTVQGWGFEWSNNAD